MTRNNKAVAFTTFNICLAIIIVVSLFFGIKSTVPSPPGRYIEVCITCAETGNPIEGLKISVTDGTHTWATLTNAQGCTGPMGSGMGPGTYTIEWYWNEPYSYEVTIDCSKQLWQYNYTVPNPTITKTFLIDMPTQGYPPIQGLNVSLYKDGAYSDSKLTDASGTVSWTVDVGYTYTLNWTWNGKPGSEVISDFYLEDGELLVCTWERTNYLEPKSGGGI